MKKLITIVAAAAVLALPAVASAAYGDQDKASCSGAAHGAFGAFDGDYNLGHGGTPVYHNGAVGQDAGATGFNNKTAPQACKI